MSVLLPFCIILYINSIVFEMDFNNSAPDSGIRNQYNTILLEQGSEYLYSILAKKNPFRRRGCKVSALDQNNVLLYCRLFKGNGFDRAFVNACFTTGATLGNKCLVVFKLDCAFRTNRNTGLATGAGLRINISLCHCEPPIIFAKYRLRNYNTLFIGETSLIIY